MDRNVGQDVQLAETVTDEHGHYQICFTTPSLIERQKKQPDLQARISASQTFLAASDVHYNATNHETLDVTLPANVKELPSEYETLTSVLAAYYHGPLSALKESDDRQDITYLANKTGWDVRAVALAALAEQFSQYSTSIQAGRSEYRNLRNGLAAFRPALIAERQQLIQEERELYILVKRQKVKEASNGNETKLELHP